MTLGAVLLTAISTAHCTSGAPAHGSPFTESNDPCASGALAPQCGLACTNDATCPEGLICGADGACAAECTAGTICENGFACSPKGRCGLDTPPPGLSDAGVGKLNPLTCAQMDVTLTKVHPRVLFLLDQSSSMHHFKFPNGLSDACKSGCRWTALKDVLIGPAANPGGLLAQLDDDAAMGVAMYSATDTNPNDGDNSFLVGPADAVCPRFAGKAFSGLSFELGAASKISTALRPATVDDDTPTAAALRTVVGIDGNGAIVDAKGFAALSNDAPKVIVLVTDGEPTMCGESSPSATARADVEAAVAQTYARGIKTFIIAIGDTNAVVEAHYKAIANAGLGKHPVQGDAKAVRPATPGELLTAIRNIVLDARTCAFDLNGRVETGMEGSGSVVLDGKPLALGTDWKLVSPSRIELVGGACTTLKSTPSTKLSATFPCAVFEPMPLH